MDKESLLSVQRLSWGRAATGPHSTNTLPIVAGQHATHHFPSFLDQGEHTQDVSLLRSPAHAVCGPGMLSSLLPSPLDRQPQTRPGIWVETENSTEGQETQNCQQLRDKCGS